MTSDRQLLVDVFDAACARLDAGRLAEQAVQEAPAHARVIALGKVAHGQMRAALAARPDLVALLSVSTDAGPEPWAVAGDHPVPGARSFEAGERLLDAVRAMDGAPLVLLLSGGGSALAEVPAAGLTEPDVQEATRVLLRSGLDVERMNAVRKRLSALKGGRLALAAPLSRWRVRVLSDVVGDDPAAVASGPCVEDRTPASLPRRACEQAGVWHALPPRVREVLATESRAPTLAGLDIDLQVVAGARQLALAAELASPVPTTVLAPVTDPVEALAERYVRFARERTGTGPRLLVASGEPTLQVRGPGRGGRCQHLALLVARELSGLDATFLAAGSDGRDGDTDHAGAIVDGSTAEEAGEALEEAIARYDSAALHEELGTALPRRAPVTHLGELHLMLVR